MPSGTKGKGKEKEGIRDSQEVIEASFDLDSSSLDFGSYEEGSVQGLNPLNLFRTTDSGIQLPLPSILMCTK